MIQDAIENRNFMRLKQVYYFLRQWNFLLHYRDNQALETGNKPTGNRQQALGSLGHCSDVLLSFCFLTPCYLNVCSNWGVRGGSACWVRGSERRLMKWVRASTWVTLSEEGKTPCLGLYKERALDIKASSRKTSLKCMSEQVQEGHGNEKKTNNSLPFSCRFHSRTWNCFMNTYHRSCQQSWEAAMLHKDCKPHLRDES